MTAQLFAEAAAGLVGCPFRLHGRDPATGLDCVGLIAAALEGAGMMARLPTGYRLRAATAPDLAQIAGEHGFVPISGTVEAGDILLTRPAAAQLHFAIAGPGRDQFVEAHAGLGRVVIRPGPLSGPVIQHWRMIPQRKASSWQP